jgi:SAM-dependent methyltransferase
VLPPVHGNDNRNCVDMAVRVVAAMSSAHGMEAYYGLLPPDGLSCARRTRLPGESLRFARPSTSTAGRGNMKPSEQRAEPVADGASTRDTQYTVRLIKLQTAWWKRLLPVQAPYRYNVRRLRLGRTLDVGCGIGRLLVALPPGSLGIDHNPHFVEHVRALGLPAYTIGEFTQAPEAQPESFDSILLAHVIEHVDEATADEILQTFLPSVRRGGAVHFITPQERGYASDPTHVRFTDFDSLRDLAERNQLIVERTFSFPFVRQLGRLFKYNEFNVLTRKV